METSTVYFIVYFLTSLFLISSIVFIAKYRRFQDKRLLNPINAYIFGLIFLLMYMAIKTLDLSKPFVKELIPGYYNSFAVYTNYLILISDLGIILMIAACYLISVILFKETKLR